MRFSYIKSGPSCCSRYSFYSRSSFTLSASRFFLRPTIQTTTVCLLPPPHHQQNRFAKGKKISISSETKKLKSRRGTKETKVGAQRVTTTMKGDGSENEDDANRFGSSSVTFRENLLRWYDAEKRSLPWRKRRENDFASKFEHFGGDKEEEEKLEEDATKAFERWQRLASSPSSSSSREKETSSSAPTPTGGSHNNNNGSSINKSSAADDEKWREKRVMSDDQYAYGVWVSEIMSQQTQIERVAEYWSRWVKKWPTVRHLANASEEEVREMWAGLGYYRRSQFLLKGAKYVSEELKGRFPRDIIGLLKIPGIGPYTASAVGSIAFGIREAAIDGNVNRVLTRVRRIRGDPVKEKKTVDAIKRVAWELIGKEEEKEKDDDEKKEDAKSKNRPGDFNQAMMELGATVCKPKNPSCNACPISAFCEGYQHELLSDGQEPVTAYPEIAKKAEKRQEAIAVAVVSCTFENTKWFYLTKRPQNGLLADMWEFPSVFMREGELAMRSVPSNADVCDAQKFFRESDARGVSELFASVASPPCDTNNEGEEKSKVKKTEKRKQTNRRQDSLTFKHEPGVVTHVFSHVKHFMHVFTLDLGTVDALPRRRAKKEKEKENASNEQKETTTNGRRNSSLSSSSTSSSSSWFRSSDFEDKGVFSTGVQKVFAFAEKRGKHESSGDIRKRFMKSPPLPPSHPFDAGGVAEKAKKDTLLLKDDALGVENENETKKTKKTTMKKKIKIETKDIETYFTRAV